MNATLQQIQELPIRERRQFGAAANYFVSKQYFAHKRMKRVQTARTLIELEIDYDRATSITEGR